MRKLVFASVVAATFLTAGCMDPTLSDQEVRRQLDGAVINPFFEQNSQPPLVFDPSLQNHWNYEVYYQHSGVRFFARRGAARGPLTLEITFANIPRPSDDPDDLNTVTLIDGHCTHAHLIQCGVLSDGEWQIVNQKVMEAINGYHTGFPAIL